MPANLLPLHLRRRPDGSWLYPMLGRDCPCLSGESRCVMCLMADARAEDMLGPDYPSGVHPTGITKGEGNCTPCNGTERVGVYDAGTLLDTLEALYPGHYIYFEYEPDWYLCAVAKRGLDIVQGVGTNRLEALKAALEAATEEEPPPDATHLFKEAPGCHSQPDGDCYWRNCPQVRDGEPNSSGRHCPLDTEEGHDA